VDLRALLSSLPLLEISPLTVIDVLSRPASQSPLLENPDVVTWSVETVAKWFSTVPTLAHLSETFLVNSIDGKTLLRLSDRKMLINLRLASPIDRRLLLQHISDLKSLQVSNAHIAHKEVVDKIVKGLGSELEQLRVNVPASVPVSSATTKSSSTSSSHPSSSSATVDKKSPNFFLSLRVSSQEIQDRVREIQDFVQERIPALRGSKCILPPEQLHFTLGRLHLYTEEEQDKAKEVLERCSSLASKLYNNKAVTATFKGIANHGGNALFVETEVGTERDLLTELGNLVFEAFRDAGLASRNFRFIPVAPIIRIHTSKKEAIPPLKDLCASLVPAYEDDVLGKFTFDTVEISCVSSETQEDGYYKSLHSVAWSS
jgi:2'-5' RNA ligase